MRLALLLFLSILVTAVPQNSSGQTASDQHPSTKHFGTDTHPILAVFQQMFPTTQGTPDATGKHNESQDRPKITDWLMVGLTAAYIFVSALIFVAVKKQTAIAKIAADAALLNAKALINSERPWIAVRRKEPFTADVFLFEVVCVSGIPAKIIEIYADFQAVDRGQSLQLIYEKRMLHYPLMLAPPDGPKKIWDISGDILKANAPLWKAIQDQSKFLYFLGKVEYTDGISFDENGNKIIHETRWCYEYIGGGIARSGPPQFNDYT